MKLPRLPVLGLLFVSLLAPVAGALEGTLLQLEINTANVPGPVEIAVYTPPGYDPDRAESYPLIIQLHGGGGSRASMTAMAAALDNAI